ncbi:MAG: hypothetical protein B7Z15_03105 [Rhizobiales bacterium 32-66-8]|nr:MAG: hypothetical protein B7Z15_03105 [Rhizobiales bacterium 32-66-8]
MGEPGLQALELGVLASLAFALNHASARSGGFQKLHHGRQIGRIILSVAIQQQQNGAPRRPGARIHAGGFSAGFPVGENAHVGAEQVQSLFDDADVEQVAQQTQAPKQDIYNAISAVLPQIIDSLTPQGEQTSKQEANDDIQQVMNLVSGFLKR